MGVNKQESSLFVVASPDPSRHPNGRRRTSRHERQFDRAANAAKLDPRLHAAALSLGRAYAKALDVAEAKSDAYVAAQVGKPYFELLARLGLMPDLSGVGGDEFDDLGSPSLVDAEDV